MPESTTQGTPLAPARPVDPTLQTLIQALKSLQPASQGFTKDDLAEVLKNNAEGVRRSLRPENNRHPDVSVFNPQGERDHPRTKLIHDVYVANVPINEEELDLEEIAILNQFTHTKTARNGQWRAEVRKTPGGDGSSLHVSFPCATVDDRMDLPRSLKLILQELLGGEQSVDPLALGERVRALEAQLAAKK